MKDFDFQKPFERVSDVIAFLYECEHAGPYCSPSWGRNGTNAVLLEIVEHFRSHSVPELIKWLRETESKGPDSFLWDRARFKIADRIEQQLAKEQ